MAGGLIVALILRKEFWKVLISILITVAFVYGVYALVLWLPQSKLELPLFYSEAIIGVASLLAVLLLYYLLRFIWARRLCLLVYRGMIIPIPRALFKQLAQEESVLRPEREGTMIILKAEPEAINVQDTLVDN